MKPEYFLEGRNGLSFESVENIDGERLFSYSYPITDKKTGELLGVATVRFKASAIDTILTEEVKRLWGAHIDLSDSPKKGRMILKLNLTDMKDVEEVILVIDDLTELRRK